MLINQINQTMLELIMVQNLILESELKANYDTELNWGEGDELKPNKSNRGNENQQKVVIIPRTWQ